MQKSAQQIKTPRAYMSWSQFYLIEKNPKQYRRIYFQGKTSFESPPIKFGKIFAEFRETGKKGSVAIEQAKMFLPIYPKREYTMEVDAKFCRLLGKFDGYHPQKRIIADDKTGKIAWTQRRVDTDDQLSFYDLIYWLKFGRPIKILRLHWLNTITGEVKTFCTTRNTADRLRMMARTKAAWGKILEMAGEESKKSPIIFRSKLKTA